MLKGHQAVSGVAGPAVLIDLLLEPCLEPGFGCKGTHQWESFDRFSEQACELADFLLASFSCSHHSRTKQADQPGDQWGKQHDGHRELPVKPEHVAEHGYELQGAGDGVVEGLVDDLTDPIGIFGESVGEIPSREFFEGTQFHPLQPLKQVAAQRLAHLESWSGQKRVLQKLGQLLDEEDHQHHAEHGKHHVKLARAKSGDQAAHQVHQQGPAADEHRHAQEPQDQPAQVGTQQGEQPAESGFRGCQHRATLSMVIRCVRC